MDSPNIDQYVVGIYANFQGVGITLIGTNKEINTYWVYEHIYHNKATIEGIKSSLDSLFLRFPKIRKIHINNMENLRLELNNHYKKRLFTNGVYTTKTGNHRSEKRSDVKIVDLEVESLAFILNSYINDQKLFFKDSLLVDKHNLKSEIENYNFNDINQRVFSLYIAISQIEPIKSKFLCTSIPQPQQYTPFLY